MNMIVRSLMYVTLMIFSVTVNAMEMVSESSPDNQNTSQLQQLTVRMDQIHLTNEGMFVYIDNAFVPIDVLQSRGSGTYSCWVDYHNILPYETICGNCLRQYNKAFNPKCPHCGYY